MNEDDTPTVPGDEIDPGEPLQLERSLALETRDDFFERVCRRIERRGLAAELFALTWAGVSRMTTEWLDLLFNGLVQRTPKTGDD